MLCARVIKGQPWCFALGVRDPRLPAAGEHFGLSLECCFALSSVHLHGKQPWQRADVAKLTSICITHTKLLTPTVLHGACACAAADEARGAGRRRRPLHHRCGPHTVKTFFATLKYDAAALHQPPFACCFALEGRLRKKNNRCHRPLPPPALFLSAAAIPRLPVGLDQAVALPRDSYLQVRFCVCLVCVVCASL